MTSNGRPITPHQSAYCPVTGLPITSKPEWTDIRLTSDYSVTFRIIGNAILLTAARGNPGYEGIKALLEKRSWVIREAGLSDKSHVELRDYSLVTGIPTRMGRALWTDYMLKELSGGHLQGLWLFGAPLFLRLIFQAGEKMYKPAAPVGVAKDYAEAVRGALKNLRQKGVDVGASLHLGFTKEEWTLEVEGYGISFELIGDDTLYTVAHGSLKEPDVEKFFQLHEKVLQEAGLFQKGYFYRIINWERYEKSSWQVRRMYLAGMKELNKRITCKLSVVFGLNPFMKALAEVSKPFVPSPVEIAKDFQEALRMVDQARERELGARSSGKRPKLIEKSYTEAQIKGFAEEMLQVLGELNWEKVGLSVDGIGDEHPLKPVFDALAVIKLDLDELLREKEQSQKSLRESEEKYRNILESITDGYFEIDLRGNLVFCNPVLPKDLGYTQSEISGMNFRSYMDPETAETVSEIYRKAYREDAPATVTSYEVTRKDGRRIPVETLFSLIKDADGKPIGYRGTSRNITERKHAEDALRESEKRFTSIFNAQQNGIIIIDSETHTIFDANVAALQMIGATREDAVGCQCHKFICPAERGHCPITDLHMDIDQAERLLVRADKTRIPILKSVSRMTLGGKEFLIESFIDISDRKKAEDALKESEGKYRTLFENADDAIFLMDGDCFIDCNNRTPQMFGCTREQIIGQSPSFFSPPLQPDGRDSREKVLEKLRLAFSGQEQSFEWRHARYDGTLFDADVSLNVIRLNNQDFLQAIVRDVSDRKQSEEALRRKTALLEAQVNTSIDGILVVDDHNRRVITNRRLIDLWRIPQPIVEDEDDTALLKYVVSLTRWPDKFLEKVTYLYEHPHETSRDEIEFKSGMVLERYSAPVLGMDGHHYGRIWTFHDITERKQAEDALKESEEKYRNILESIDDGYFEVDLVGSITFFNPSMCTVLGYPKEEMPGLSYRKCMEAPKEVSAHFNEVYKTGVPKRGLEWVFIQKDGARKHHEVSVSLKKDPQGRPIGFQGTARDISERKKAEAALRESEEKYRNILESIEDGYFEVDVPGSLTFFNPAMCHILGYDKEEMHGMSYTKYMDEDSIKRVYKSFVEIYTTGVPSKGFEWHIIRKDGARKNLEVSVSLVKDAGGKPTGFRGIARDVSIRKKAEDALKESEEKYRNILESIEDGYFEVDLNGTFKFFNPAMATILGYPKEEMPGLNYTAFMDNISIKRVFKSFVKIYKTGVPSRGFDWDIIQKNGDRKHLEVSVSLMFGPEGSPDGFRGIARDVSKRKIIELELKKHREHLEEMIRERTTELTRTTNFLSNIINSSMDGIITTDIEGTILHTSPRIKDILGYEQHELMGKKTHTLFAGGHEETEKILNQLTKEGGIRGYEFESRRASGESIVLNLSISLLRDEKGDVIGTTGIYRDVTEEKRMEEAMKQAMVRAELASKAKSQFLANMSHEIRTPLNGILGMADLCLETKLNREQRRLIETLDKEGRSLLDIVNEVLDFEKIEAGKIEVEEIPFDLSNLLEDVAQSSSYRMTRKGLTFISYIAPGVPTRVVGDPGRLRQVLRNLIDNAIKFTDKGGIDVKVDLLEETDDKIKLRFLVKDTGIGIPKDKQALVLESFTQADGSTTRKYGGTGLGVTISKQLAELMGGTLCLESEEGRGSTFWFTVVLSRQSETDSPTRKEVSLNRVKVLVVDGNPTSRGALVKTLRSWGAVPVEAQSAAEALSILKAPSADGDGFHLVLSDLNMPEMNGFDLAREIKKLEPLPSVPTIILAVRGNPGDGKTCRDIGIAGYLTKPFSESDLRRALEIVLGTATKGGEKGMVDLVTRHSTAEIDRKDIRILLAEDYPTNQEIVKKYLNRAGYQVDLAEDGMQALETFKRRRYDLILMDVQMPVMDGFQATAAIRKAEAELAVLGNENASRAVFRIPIVAMTAHAMSEHRELCLAAGMDDFLSKPITRKGLLAMTEKWLRSSPERPRLPETAGLAPAKAGQEAGPTEAGNGKPMDLERALEEFEGDREVLAEVIEGFTKKVGEQIGTLRQALSCGDAETVRKEAHAIKGGGANLTAANLSRVAFELENRGKAKELDGAADIVDGLERELAALTRYVQENFPKLGELTNFAGKRGNP